jgi:hypothetical protein
MKLFSATTKETMKKERKSGEGKEKDDNVGETVSFLPPDISLFLSSCR